MLIIGGAVMLSNAACTKHFDVEILEDGRTVVTERLSARKEGDATKVTMNANRQFGWSSGDNVAFTIFGDGVYSFAESDTYGATTPDKFTVTYSGTRQGYAVTPAVFKKSFDGSTLVVSYPTSYSIAEDVDAGINDNADGNHFIAFPMVAASSSGSPTLTFYSIGAMVKVVVSAVPIGTKSLYITFNQVVTGDFTVSDPGTSTSKVTVSDTGNTSTVRVEVSTYGLTSERNITLYIPVPTTENLYILSAGPEASKPTVARNGGYQFSVNAIQRVDRSTDYLVGADNYVISEGNLLRHNTGLEPEYLIEEPLKTTLGAYDYDPHRNGDTTVPGSREYQDLFSWNDVYSIFTGGDASGMATATIPWGATIVDNKGVEWHLLSQNVLKGIADMLGTRTKKNSIRVGDRVGPVSGKVQIRLDDPAGSGYGIYREYDLSPENMVFGRFMFPDGYIDQTDLLTDEAFDDNNRVADLKISYQAARRMLDAGAVFMINGGYFSGKINEAHNVNWAYWLDEAVSLSSAVRADGYKDLVIKTGDRSYYRGVRMVRISSRNDEGNSSTQGFGNKPETSW